MVLLRFSYQLLYNGVGNRKRLVNGENCLYFLLEVPQNAPLGVWEALPNAWYEG